MHFRLRPNREIDHQTGRSLFDRPANCNNNGFSRIFLLDLIPAYLNSVIFHRNAITGRESYMNLFRLIKYSFGSLSAFLLDLLLIYIFVRLGMNENLAILIAFLIIGFTYSYLFHKNITFNAGNRSGQYSKYSVTSVVVLFLDIGLSILFTQILIKYYMDFFNRDLLIMAGKTLGSSAAGIVNYMFLYIWVFSEAVTPKNESDTVIHK